MPIPATSKGGTDFAPIPAGNHHAVCYGVVDLGTQPSNNPAFNPARKVLILWELPHERSDFPDKDDKNKTVNKARAISASYTLSLSDRANLRKMLESWRAKPFSEEELQGFDISRLIGANCFLSVIHKNGSGQNASKTYANVTSVSSLPKGTTKMNPENSPLYFSFFDLRENELPTFPENMPEWIQEKIKQSDEYTARSQASTGHTAASTTEDLDEDVPF